MPLDSRAFRPRMSAEKDSTFRLSRRAFLRGMRLTPLLFLPAPLQATTFPSTRLAIGPLALGDFNVKPQYPVKSPLEDMFRYVQPGSDSYVTEKYAHEIRASLDEWSKALRLELPALGVVRKFSSPTIESTP